MKVVVLMGMMMMLFLIMATPFSKSLHGKGEKCSFVMMITFERNDGFYSKYRDATQTGHWVGEMK